MKVQLPLVLLVLVYISCSKEITDDGPKKSLLELRADTLRDYVLEKHFIPVDFYADHKIDYNQDDAVIDSVSDLKDFIYRYLQDDRIVFRSDSLLYIDQGGNQDGVHERTFTMPWGITSSKAKNELYLTYVDYLYKTTKYTLDYHNENEMLAHVSWQSTVNPADKALLYTLFRKM